MNHRNEEREIEDLLQKAEASPVRQSRLRQETLSRLINLVHSDSTALKILAARNIRFFLIDFPDLEGTAIDAIYDLCEDLSPKVRLEGYRAITQVSRTQSRWIKRNVDVLVQLLQSEEIDEVMAVKKALVDHLEMDPSVTLGVLCDQIIPPDDATDEEEISVRDRLRSLVLGFLTGEAKLRIRERHALPGESGESALYGGLFAAIPRLGAEDLEFVLKDLLYALPAFKSQNPTERGSELLQLLLTKKALIALNQDLHSDLKALSASRAVLQHCEYLTCTLQAAPAVDLLQFFCSSLIGKITLQKIQVTDRQWIVCSLSRVLGTAQRQQQTPRFLSLRRIIIDACPYLLEVFKNSLVSQSELSNTYGVFLEVCLERAQDPSWTLPPHLFKALQDFQKRPEIIRNKDYETKIRSLESLSKIPLQATSPQGTDAHRKALTVRSPTIHASGLHSVQSVPNLSRPVHTPLTTVVKDRTKRDIASEIFARPTKKTKVEEVANTPQVPSLLNRLGTSIRRQSSWSDLSPQTEISPPMSEVEDSQPNHGFSIKGAATKQERQSSLSTRVTPSSLLERLQDPPRGDAATQQHDVRRKKRNV